MMDTKTTGRPRRPLSPFNLFYRFKRIKLLNACIAEGNNKEHLKKLIMATPGLEDYDPNVFKVLPPKAVQKICRDNIKDVLENDLSPHDNTKRAHRKNNKCAIGFVEMSRVMSSSWKKTDTFAQAVFHELYKEGKEVYKHDIAEYKMASSPEVKRGSSNDVYSQQHGNISGTTNRANIQESTNHEAPRRGSATNSSSTADDNSMNSFTSPIFMMEPITPSFPHSPALIVKGDDSSGESLDEDEPISIFDDPINVTDYSGNVSRDEFLELIQSLLEDKK